MTPYEQACRVACPLCAIGRGFGGRSSEHLNEQGLMPGPICTAPSPLKWCLAQHQRAEELVGKLALANERYQNLGQESHDALTAAEGKLAEAEKQSAELRQRLAILGPVLWRAQAALRDSGCDHSPCNERDDDQHLELCWKSGHAEAMDEAKKALEKYVKPCLFCGVPINELKESHVKDGAYPGPPNWLHIHCWNEVHEEIAANGGSEGHP